MQQRHQESERPRRLFASIANRASQAAGRASAFVFACAVIVIWAVTGPLFRFSDTWQLVINTGTTIVTFLMVFLIQNSQTGSNRAAQKQCADKNLGTKFRQRGNSLYLAVILRRGKRLNPARLSDILFSFHFGFSAAVEDLRWRVAVPRQGPTIRSGPDMLRPGIEALWTRRTIAAGAVFRRQR